MFLYRITRLVIIAIMILPVAQAATARKLPVYQLPFDQDEYPYDITLSIHNTTHEPIFFLTRYVNKSIEGDIIVQPFTKEEYTITVASLSEINKTWILFSFNEDLLQKLAAHLDTSRHIRYIVRTRKEPVGIITIARQKSFQPTLRTITINSVDLKEEGAWVIT